MHRIQTLGTNTILRNVNSNKNNKEENINLYEKVDRLKEYSNLIVENAYYNEIESFFDAIENNTEQIYSFEKDKKVLDLIDKIES